jgi:membrane-associated phospholipid phosphatase
VNIEAVLEWLWGPDPIVAVQQVFGPGWMWVAEAVSLLGSGMLAVVVFALLYWGAGRDTALWVLSAVVLGALVVSILWPLFDVARPNAPSVAVRVEPGVPSFPSGHVLATMTLWGSLALAGGLPVAVPFVLALLVGVARLALGAHYLGDVLVAIPLGVAVLAAHRRLYPALASQIGRWSSRTRLLCGVVAALLVLPAGWLVAEGWLIFGAALAAGIGLRAEPRLVGYVAAPVGRGRQVARATVGLAVLAAAALPLLLGIDRTWQAVVGAVAMLWVILAAPALFVRLGWAASSLGAPADHPTAGAVSAASPRRTGGPPWTPTARRAVTAIAAMVAAAVGLVLWLFPSLWAVGQAVVDIDQSAGPEVGVNLTEVANHPAAMWGRTVTISGRITAVVDERTAIIGNDAFFVGDRVAVASGQLGAELADLVENPAAGVLREGVVIRVTGVVRPLARDDLRDELAVGPVAALMDPEQLAVLEATAIELDPPAYLVAGDKEFPSGGSGFEVGVTINEIVGRPEAYLGRIVGVSDEIDEPALGAHAFVLGDEQLLVVMAEPNPDVFLEATGYVVGEVVRFEVAAVEERLGIDLDDAAVERFVGEPAIVARSVEVVA